MQTRKKQDGLTFQSTLKYWLPKKKKNQEVELWEN
jgi:hypothetical protein